MTAHFWIGGICLAAAMGIALRLLYDLLLWVYREGRERGRCDAEKAFVSYEKAADQARQQIWRDEARR